MVNFLKIIIKIIKNIFMLILGITEGIIVCLKSLFSGCKRLNKTKTEKVFLAGNGPSLSKTDLLKVKENGFEILCVNYFPSNDERFWVLKPKYLCLMDPSFFLGAASVNVDQNNKLFETLGKVEWDLTIVTSKGRRLPVSNNYIKYEWITPFSFINEHVTRFRYFMYHNNLANCGNQNVAIAALYFLISKGVKDIYISGVDITDYKQYSVNKDNDVIKEEKHYYGSGNKINFVEKGLLQKGEFFKMFEWYAATFKEFNLASKYAEKSNIRVINTSMESYVDAFKREEF